MERSAGPGELHGCGVYKTSVAERNIFSQRGASLIHCSVTADLNKSVRSNGYDLCKTGAWHAALGGGHYAAPCFRVISLPATS